MFSHTIAYVADVEATLTFFETAFGFQRRFVTPEKDYGELDSGATTLAFAVHGLAHSNLPDGYVAFDQTDAPPGIEISLTTDDVTDMHMRAINAGAHQIMAPHPKPWGQIVSYVRCPAGILIALGSPMAESHG